jgi:hypothetical protein
MMPFVKVNRLSRCCLTLLVVGLFISIGKTSIAEIMQVHEDFSNDPGWEEVNNRVVASDPPLVNQDFGWSPTGHLDKGQGEIGGTVFQSRTPAWYALPLGRPLTFNDHFSASGKIAVLAYGTEHTKGAAYIGFFNSRRQGWRPWNSVAIRVTREYSQAVTFGIDSMSAAWNGHGFETDVRIPADGRAHLWRLRYDPDAVPPKEWPDHLLQSYLSLKRQTPEEILQKARKAEPNVTLEQIRRRLQDALANGFVAHFNRTKGSFFTLQEDFESRKGRIALQIDDGPEYRDWLPAWLRNASAAMDRFGIFNLQMYHRMIQFYLADLMVNGEKIDLNRDPGWEGHGNRVRFFEEEFQRQDFGYSQTNWAGNGIGEIGGEFYRTEPNDPLHGYYAADIGQLSLDDPISFSGNICFVDGSTDSGVFFGYFNARDYIQDLPASRPGMPLDNMMGVVVEGPTRIGFRFNALCSPKAKLASRKDGPVFLPTARPHRFSFAYDPEANKNLGRITIKLDSHTFELNLTPAQRAAGAMMNRFGMASIRKGGKCLTVYLDDLTYTANQPATYRPVRHPQRVVTVPFPAEGRKVW